MLEREYHKERQNAFMPWPIPHMADAPEARKQLIENISKGLQELDSHDDPVVREFLALLGDDTLSEDLRKELCQDRRIQSASRTNRQTESCADCGPVAAEIDPSIEKSDPQKMMHLIEQQIYRANKP